VEKGTIVLSHVPTQDQLADIFTKPLDQATFVCLRGGTWGVLPFLVDSWGISFLYHMYHTMFTLIYIHALLDVQTMVG
jgi:hypothetical protein